MKRLLIRALPLVLALAAVFCIFFLHQQRGRVTILMYHHLVEDGEETNSLTVTRGKFRKDMEYLRAQGCTVLSPEELVAVLNGSQKCPKRAVVISFDDGYQSNYAIAYPILREYGFRAVIALVTANIRDGEEGNTFMLSWPEVQEMAESGVISFGSHTDNLHNPDIGGELRKGPHAVNGVQRLPDETPETYRERVGTDLERSFGLIETHTGTPVQWFAYPYGACDAWCEELLTDAGVPISVTTEPGYTPVNRGSRDLPRFAVREDTELSQILPD